MDKFKYEGFVDILHLNTRKEGPEDEKQLAVDIKLQTKTNSKICSCFSDELEGFLFLADGDVRNRMINPITFDHEMQNYSLTVLEREFSGVTVKKISLQPINDFFVLMVFTVSFNPTSTEIAMFAEFLQNAMDIKLEAINEELF